MTGNDSQSYVYAVFRPNGIPCYVGKGKGDRWRRHDRKRKQNPHFAAILNSAGGDLPVVVIRSDLNDREAIHTEVALIAVIGREINGGPLVNLTDGGDGTAGWKAGKAWRENRSAKSKELWKTPDFRALILRPGRKRSGNKSPRSEGFKRSVSQKLRGNKHMLGLKHSEKSKKLMSEKRKGVPKSPEHRAKISQANRGHVVSDETREKLRLALSGRTMPEERRLKISASSKGKRKPAGFAEKISAISRARWADPSYVASMSRKMAGRKPSEKTIAAVSEVNRRRVISEETRIRLRAAKRNRRHSDETKVKMAESARRRHAERKAFVD